MPEQAKQHSSIEKEAVDSHKCIPAEEIGSCIASAVVELGEKSPYGKQILSLIAQPGVEAYNRARDILGKE